MPRNLLGLLLFTLCGMGAPAFAEVPSFDRNGFDIQSFQKGSSITQGMMLGYRGRQYLSDTKVSVGFEIHTGSRDGGRLQDDSFTYGGFSVGIDGLLTNLFTYDLSLMAGYGVGNITSLNASGAGFTVQPTLGIGVVMVDGWRASFVTGFLYSEAGQPFSGVTFGIRFDRKTFSAVKGIDN